MAQATTKRFGQAVIVQLSNGATPPVFAAPCGFTERALNLSKEVGESQVPDCDDPDKASWVERDVVSKSATISGSGVMAVEAFNTWEKAYDEDVSIACRVFTAGNAAAGGGHWAGKFHLTSFEMTATKGQRVEVSVTMESDGPVEWVPAV